MLSYGGNLSLTQRFNSGGYDEESEPGIDVALVSDDITITWSNPIRLREGQSLVSTHIKLIVLSTLWDYDRAGR